MLAIIKIRIINRKIIKKNCKYYKGILYSHGKSIKTISTLYNIK